MYTEIIANEFKLSDFKKFIKGFDENEECDVFIGDGEECVKIAEYVPVKFLYVLFETEIDFDSSNDIIFELQSNEILSQSFLCLSRSAYHQYCQNVDKIKNLFVKKVKKSSEYRVVTKVDDVLKEFVGSKKEAIQFINNEYMINYIQTFKTPNILFSINNDKFRTIDEMIETGELKI